MPSTAHASAVVEVSVKLPVTGKEVLRLPSAKPTGYGLGKSGWVTVHFQSESDVPVDTVTAYLDPILTPA
ncbi:MAG: hypothetical protein ABI678_25895, partial [Kofleriaceae bacterium]